MRVWLSHERRNSVHPKREILDEEQKTFLMYHESAKADHTGNSFETVNSQVPQKNNVHFLSLSVGKIKPFYEIINSQDDSCTVVCSTENTAIFTSFILGTDKFSRVFTSFSRNDK